MKKIFIAAALLVAGSAQAGTILAPTAVVGGNLGEYATQFDYGNMLDQSGLSQNYISGSTDFGTFLSGPVKHTGADNLSWLSTFGKYSGFIVFDLGAVFNVNQMVLWNGAGGVTASPSSFNVSTSLTSNFSVSQAGGSFAGNMLYTGTVYDLANTSARFVRMDIAGNFGNGCCVAIGDIAFDVTQAAAVPEPGSLALLGLGVAGFAFSRRMKKSASK